jgi:hypothetical protein
MARGNQSERNLRKETQAEIDAMADEQAGLQYGEDIAADIEPDQGLNQTGYAQGATAMRTKATPKTAAEQSTSMKNKKGNQPPNR